MPSELSPLTQPMLEADLQRLGLGQGAVVGVHSSPSSFGRVIDGTSTVIAALMSAIGPNGTLVMSAYPVNPAIPHAGRQCIVDSGVY